MEKTPDNFDNQIEQISEEGINIESAHNLITEMDAKIAGGATLNTEDVAEVREKLNNLRDVQPEIDSPEMRNAIVRLSSLLESTE